MHHPTDRIAHTTAFVTPVVEHWLEREIAHWVHPMKDRSDDPSHHERTLLPRSYISLLLGTDTFFPFFLQFIIYYKSNTLMPVSDYQVRLVSLTCTFRASCYSARLLRAQMSAPLSGTGKKGMEGGGGGGGGRLY